MKDKKIEKLLKKAKKIHSDELECYDDIVTILKMSYGYPDDVFLDYVEGDGFIIGFVDHPELETVIIKDEIIPFDKL